MLALFLKIISVFFASLLGALLHRKLKFDIRTLTDLIIYIGAPCLTFSTISSHQYQASVLGLLIVSMLGLFLFTFLATKILMSAEVRQNKGIYLTTCFMNTAGMGFPVTLLILGEAAFAYAVILDLTMILVMFTFGVLLMDRHSGLWGPFKLPVIYAATVGFMFNIFDIELPQFILHVIKMLAGLTVPLLLISLGARLSELKVDKFKVMIPIKATMIRLVGGLIIALLITGIFDFPQLVKQVFILYAILPAPLMSYVLTNKYHHNDVVIAETILLSTAASFIFIPLVVHFI